MVMKNIPILWTDQAKNDLRSIYDFWKQKSLQAAKNVRLDLLNSPKTIVFAKQYQLDDITPKYRRIVVRKHYKLLYKAVGHNIYVMGVVSAAQSPTSIKNK